MKEQDPKKAITLSDQAEHILPENSCYLERNGYLKWQAGDLDNALEATLEAISLNPSLIDAHMNLGEIYRNLGNLDQALASTLKSLELKPDNPDAHMNLGGIYKDLGNRDQALAFLTKAMKSEKTKEKAAVLNSYLTERRFLYPCREFRILLNPAGPMV